VKSSSASRDHRLPIGGRGASTTIIHYPSNAPAAGPALILAHGAGAGQYSAFMTSFAGSIASKGIDVVTFDFPYMESRRKLPDRPPVLESCYAAVIEHVQHELRPKGGLFIGGKSMGARIGSQVAAKDRAIKLAGLILLGYPLHPPGRPGERRDAHLPQIHRPILFVQGSRDAFGTPVELRPILRRLAPAPDLHVVGGGDHSFKVSRGSDQAKVFEGVQERIAVWIHSHSYS
jgi:predicted alpha/beta-hydrolase family hydrolase